METSYSFTPTAPTSRLWWQVAQAVVLIITVALIVGLFLRPDDALNVLWNVLIPILPATFLISAAMWRNICPLATLNIISNGLGGRRRLTQKYLPVVGTVGIVLLMIMVPARRFLFNEHGVILAVVIIAVAVAALLLGVFFDLKAGFCNAICPVLPVEKLYGQYPLIKVGNSRCVSCTVCTAKGCLDLSPKKSILQSLNGTRHSFAWLKKPYGIFAAAFPGFIVGYFTTADVALAAAGSIYLNVLAWAGGSYLLMALLVRISKMQAVWAMPILAALSVGLYYWFASPLIAETFSLTTTGTVVLRIVTLGLVVVWLWRAMLRIRRNSSGSSSSLRRMQAGPLPHASQV